MQIRSAKFVKGIVGPDPLLEDGKPQVVFLGRSNVGKSSTINALTRTPGLAKHSAIPGKTKEINAFLINGTFYLLDFPGYGFSASSKEQGNRQQDLIAWYLFSSDYVPAIVVLLIDANVGATRTDIDTLQALDRRKHTILVAANKTDALKPSRVKEQLRTIQESIGVHALLSYSAKREHGITQLGDEIAKFL